MKVSCIAIITVAVSTVTGAYIDSTSADKTAVDGKFFNGTTYGHQNSVTVSNDTTSTNITTSDSSFTNEDATTESVEAEKEYQEDVAEVIEDIALDIQDDLEDNKPLPPGKLCAIRRKPRCCEAGGRLYKDGCERLSTPLPANRNEFRSTCEEVNKVAYCCKNSVDMAQIGVMCRKPRK
ncbi:hypothetical protein ACHAPF_003473 [Botrytis cinerea]